MTAFHITLIIVVLFIILFCIVFKYGLPWDVEEWMEGIALIVALETLIITICKQRLNGIKEMGYELEDLMQIANMAVYEAIKTYSEYENAKFYTYVAKCIHNRLTSLSIFHSS